MSWSRRDFLSVSLGSLAAWQAPRVCAEEAANETSLFLSGNFAPVHEEQTAAELTVIGQIPNGLEGMFVRNGPNPQFPPIGHYHWFDGDGMLHGVRLQGGKASYRNRYVRTDGYLREKAAGKALWKGMSNPIDLSLMAKGESIFKNAANTALVWHNGKLLALWEGGPPHEIQVPDLETVGPYNFDGMLRHSFTAHPKVDPATGEMMFFGYALGAVALVYSVADRDGKIVLTEPIKLPRPVMMHDFAVTPNYSIFMDLPAAYNMAGAMRGESLLRYNPDYGARFGIIPRHGKGSDIRWFETDPCYVFHTLNAYESGDEVVLLACRMNEYPTMIAFGAPQQVQNWDDFLECPPYLYRWTFNLKTGRTKEEPIDDQPVDFPRSADHLLGKQNRYGYCMEMRMDGLLKYDLVSGKSVRHPHGEGRFGGEGVFVPRPDAKAEDEGWLLTYVHDESSGHGELVIIDAQDFAGPPVARVLIPARIPYGFHGCWIPEAALPA